MIFFLQIIAENDILQPDMVGLFYQDAGLEIKKVSRRIDRVTRRRHDGFCLITRMLPAPGIVAIARPCIKKVRIADGGSAEIITQFITDIELGGKMTPFKRVF